MNNFQFLTRWFHSRHTRKQRYAKNVFKTQRHQDILIRNGFVILPFLMEDDLKELNDGAKQFIRSIPGGLKDTFYPSGRAEDTKLRNFAAELTKNVFYRRADMVFDQHQADWYGGTLLIKPTGANSELYPHQDSSLVDERTSYSLYAWVPLTDVHEVNGSMTVIPGSHKWNNPQRSLEVPWAFSGYEAILKKYAIPLRMKAGEILIFDAALIHGSLPNETDKVRVAANYVIKPKNTDFIHCFRADDTPPGKVEYYQIDLDFFLNYNFRVRPTDPKYPFVGLVDQITMDLKEATVEKMCMDALKTTGYLY